MSDSVRESLQHVQGVQNYALRDLSRAWFPLVLYAGFAVVALTVPARVDGFLWIMAGPAVAGATALYAYQYRRDTGIEGSALAYVAVSFGLLTVALALGVVAFALGQPALTQFVPSVVMAVGYALLARMRRNAAFAVAAAATAVATVGVAMFGLNSGLTQWVLALSFVSTILLVRLASSRRRIPA
jgi:hypothetical protein